jgi:hypothetical protein
MAVTQSTDLFSAQVLIDAVRGRFKRKNAFMGSPLVSGGAVRVLPTFPKGGPGAINKTVDVPYYGVLGGFADNPEGSSATAQKIAQTSEQATVGRSSLMVETSVLAQGVAAGSPELGDPVAEAADQAMQAAEREMDRIIMSKIKDTTLVHDKYSSGSPVYFEPRHLTQSLRLLGDDREGIVAIGMHSLTLSDLELLTDGNGRPMYTMDIKDGIVQHRLSGIPIVVSDSTTLDGSTMGSVTSAGTSPPVLTLAGEPTGPWNLKIECVLGGAHATATYRFSTDGGQNWSATIVTPAAAVVVALEDTAVDSLVGNNGKTGITVAFAAGTFNADNEWTATANLQANTFILQKDAAIFWYNSQRLGAKTDVDIAEDTDLFAMHLYYAAHMYRRRRMGARPGVVRITHNVRDYIG